MKNQPPAQQRLSRFLWLGVFVFLIFAGSELARQHLTSSAEQTPATAPEASEYNRIVGLAPSIVEVIYQLDLDDQLVGISRFCKHPPEAVEKPVVGGFLDLNFEALIRLKPDCVILLEEQQSVADKLDDLGIQSVIIDHASTQGIIDSIRILSHKFKKQDAGERILSSIEKRIQRIEQIAAQHTKNSAKKPTVLVCIGRDSSATAPSKITAAGNKGVHQEYITMAGGTNAYQGNVAYPIISREKLIHLNPDIIIDLVSEDTWKNYGASKLLQQWQSYGELKAVNSQSVFFLHENKHMIPGPRFVDTLEAFSEAFSKTLLSGHISDHIE